MSTVIAIFNKQNDVSKVVSHLERMGVHPHHIQVIAKNSDHSQLIRNDTRYHVQSMQDLIEDIQHMDHDDAYVTAPIAVPQVNSNIPYLGVHSNDMNIAEDDDIISAFAEMGLSNSAAKKCRNALEDGSYAVIVRADVSPADTNLQALTSPVSTKIIADEVFQKWKPEQIIHN